MEQLINNATTTLSSSITNSATSIDVTNGSVFPSVGNFRISIYDEILLCTARSGNILTVVRGQEGTTPVAHADFSAVRSLLTAGGFDKWFSELIHRDTFANRIVAGSAGRLFLANDNNYIERDNGSTWDTYGILNRFTPPIDADFSWINQGTASIITDTTETILQIPETATNNLRLRKKSTPATPYSIIAFINLLNSGLNGTDAGLFWRESGTGEVIVVGLGINSSVCTFRVAKWDSSTTFNSEYKSVNLYNLPSCIGGMWIKISDDGTNRKVHISGDGFNWCQFHSIGRTDFLTANEVGYFGLNTNATANTIVFFLYSWKEGS